MGTRDEEGNVEGKYGYLNEEGEIVIVEYSANNSTGFTSDADSGVAPSAIAGPAPVPVTPSPEFALEKQRHEAVLAHQARVIERQNAIARQRDDNQQRRQFAAQRGQQGRPQRPVFNAAQFNPNQPAAQQFNNQNFNQDFRQFQQQQQFAPQQQQQFAPQQQQQFAPQQPQRPAFEAQFQDFQQRRQQQQFAPPQQQFAPEQPRAPLVPVSQLTREDIALQGFSRDEDQDGQIDPLPAHLQPALPAQQPAFQQPQQFQQAAFQPQQFQQQQFQQPRQQFRQPAPVAPSPAGQQFFQQPQQPSAAFQTGF